MPARAAKGTRVTEPASASAVEPDRRGEVSGEGDGERTFGGFEAGLRCEPAGEQRLRERHRRSVSPGDARDG